MNKNSIHTSTTTRNNLDAIPIPSQPIQSFKNVRDLTTNPSTSNGSYQRFLYPGLPLPTISYQRHATSKPVKNFPIQNQLSTLPPAQPAQPKLANAPIAPNPLAPVKNLPKQNQLSTLPLAQPTQPKLPIASKVPNALASNVSLAPTAQIRQQNQPKPPPPHTLPLPQQRKPPPLPPPPPSQPKPQQQQQQQQQYQGSSRTQHLRNAYRNQTQNQAPNNNQNVNYKINVNVHYPTPPMYNPYIPQHAPPYQPHPYPPNYAYNPAADQYHMNTRPPAITYNVNMPAPNQPMPSMQTKPALASGPTTNTSTSISTSPIKSPNNSTKPNAFTNGNTFMRTTTPSNTATSLSTTSTMVNHQMTQNHTNHAAPVVNGKSTYHTQQQPQSRSQPLLQIANQPVSATSTVQQPTVSKTQPVKKSYSNQPSFTEAMVNHHKPKALTLNPITNLSKAQISNLPVVFAYRLDDDGTSESIAIAKSAQYKIDREAALAKKRTLEERTILARAKKRKAEREAFATRCYTTNASPFEQDPAYPVGWMLEYVERKHGETKGQKDRYWYSPLTKKRFRSRVEVERYLAMLELVKGDEDLAFKYFKQPGLAKHLFKKMDQNEEKKKKTEEEKKKKTDEEKKKKTEEAKKKKEKKSSPVSLTTTEKSKSKSPKQADTDKEKDKKQTSSNSISSNSTPNKSETKAKSSKKTSSPPPHPDSKNNAKTPSSTSSKIDIKTSPSTEAKKVFKTPEKSKSGSKTATKSDSRLTYYGPAPRLPKGWVLQILPTSALARERFWFSPRERFKFKSLNDVRRFLAALERADGDEKKASIERSQIIKI